MLGLSSKSHNCRNYLTDPDLASAKRKAGHEEIFCGIVAGLSFRWLFRMISYILVGMKTEVVTLNPDEFILSDFPRLHYRLSRNRLSHKNQSIF